MAVTSSAPGGDYLTVAADIEEEDPTHLSSPPTISYREDPSSRIMAVGRQRKAEKENREQTGDDSDWQDDDDTLPLI